MCPKFPACRPVKQYSIFANDSFNIIFNQELCQFSLYK